MSTIGSTLTTLTTSVNVATSTNLSTTSILSNQQRALNTRLDAKTLNPKGTLNSIGLKNTQSSKLGMDRDIAHQSMYNLDLVRNWLPPENFNPPQQLVLEGRGHVETKMNYAELNGWLNDIPVAYTVMMANRSYERTDIMFGNRTKRIDNTTTNAWIM